MKYIDIIKNSFLENFSSAISIEQILLSLLTAFIIAIFIVFVYKKTYTGVVYSKNFSLCLILLSMITSLIICTINSNLSLSLGMVGALSIVRFRTAIKEPLDTVFMFWAIAIGIMCGAGLYVIALLASLLVGIFYFVSYIMGFKAKSQYLLILKYDIDYDDKIIEKINKLGKTKLKSKSAIGNTIEASYEIEVTSTENILSNFEKDTHISNASIISYQNDFGA